MRTKSKNGPEKSPAVVATLSAPRAVVRRRKNVIPKPDGLLPLGVKEYEERRITRSLVSDFPYKREIVAERLRALHDGGARRGGRLGGAAQQPEIPTRRFADDRP